MNSSQRHDLHATLNRYRWSPSIAAVTSAIKSILKESQCVYEVLNYTRDWRLHDNLVHWMVEHGHLNMQDAASWAFVSNNQTLASKYYTPECQAQITANLDAAQSVPTEDCGHCSGEIEMTSDDEESMDAGMALR